MAEGPQHGVQITVDPFHRVGLRIEGWRKGQSNASPWKASCIIWDWKYVALSVCTCNGWPNHAYNICKARNTFLLVVLLRGMASNHLPNLQHEQVPVAFGANA